MQLDFTKGNGLLPAIIQDATSLQVLMCGYMNEEAFQKTNREGKVTFYSRSKQRLWTKGESSGNYLIVEKMIEDCDADALLVMARPSGPVCHTGHTSCFGASSTKGFMYQLEEVIAQRIEEKGENSYTSSLFDQGVNKIAQKVGEEAVELVIEAKDNNADLFSNEAADLLYHLLVLMRFKDLKLRDIEKILQERHAKVPGPNS